MLEQKQRVGISQKTKQTVLVFYGSKSVVYSQGRKIVSIWLPDKTKMEKQKQLLLSNISEIYAQFKRENPDRKISFLAFALFPQKWFIPVGAAGTHFCVCI